MTFASWRPTGPATRLVESFYLFGPAEGYSGAPLTGLIVPDGHVEIGMVVSGAFFDRHEGAWTPFPECYADRILTEATAIRCEPGSLLLAAKLRFGAAPAVLGCAASALAHREPLVDVLERRGRNVVKMAGGGRNVGELTAGFESLLDGLAAAPCAVDPVVDHVAGRLARDDVRMAALDVETAVSWRTLETRFRRCLGMPPKRFARIRRLRRVIAALGRAGTSQADCALEAGFCDQSHLVREFRALTGLTPGAFFEARQFVSELLAPAAAVPGVSDLSKTGNPPRVNDRVR